MTSSSVPVPFNILGKSFTLIGTPQRRAPYRMVCDFMAGDDILFHFNPRFRFFEKVVVRNVRLSGSWGTEERYMPIPFPFQYGVPFKIEIFVNKECFRVKLNNMDICTWTHRKFPVNVDKVCVSGSVNISQMGFNL